MVTGLASSRSDIVATLLFRIRSAGPGHVTGFVNSAIAGVGHIRDIRYVIDRPGVAQVLRRSTQIELAVDLVRLGRGRHSIGAT